MSIIIHIPSVLSNLTNDQMMAEANGGTLGECLQQVLDRFPRLKSEVFGKDGQLSNNIEVFINQKSTYPNELARLVKDGDEIHIVDVVIGG